MTNRHIMTEAEARALPMPETHHLRTRNGEWAPFATRAAGPEPWVLAHIAADVANGYLPSAVLDHAIAASRGEEWHSPDDWTPERKAASLALVRAVRNEDESVLRGDLLRLCNTIDPPPPLPEIAPCPYCGGECRVYGAGNSWHVECVASSTEEHVACCYHGPTAPTNRAAIEAHNRVAKALEGVGRG